MNSDFQQSEQSRRMGLWRGAGLVLMMGTVVLSLAGCGLTMEGAPQLRRSDLAVDQDLSGAYHIADKFGAIVADSAIFVDRISQGEYRFAMAGQNNKSVEMVGYIYDIATLSSKDRILAIRASANTLDQKSNANSTEFYFIRIVDKNRVILFSGSDIGYLSEEYGIKLDRKDGTIIGVVSVGQLRAALADPAFAEDSPMVLERSPGSVSWPSTVNIPASVPQPIQVIPR